MKTFFIGNDFSQGSIDLACIKECGERTEELGHIHVDNNENGYKTGLEWAYKLASANLEPGEEFKKSSILFCGEDTGVCSEGFANFLYNEGVDVWIQNPYDISCTEGFHRGKSDKADAWLIAEYARSKRKSKKFRLYQPREDAVVQLRDSLKMYRSLTKDRVRVDLRMKSGRFDHSTWAMGIWTKQLEGLDQAIDDADKRIKEILTNEFSRTYTLLDSIIGFGHITIAVFVVETHNFKRIETPEAFATHVGVAPFKNESGKIKHKEKVSKFRSSEANAIISQAVISAVVSNPIIHEYFNRLVSRGKGKGIAYTACKNKLIHLAYAVIKSGIPFDPELHGLNSEDRRERYAQMEQKRLAEEQRKAEVKAARDKARAEKEAEANAKKAAKKRMEEIVLELSSSTPPDGMKRWTLPALADAASKFRECVGITPVKIGRILRKNGTSTVERKRK